MDTENTDDAAAMPPASAGSQLREQIAALVHDAMRFDREAKTPKWQGGNSYAESRARQAAWEIATLSQPTLTDAELDAVKASVQYWAGPFRHNPHPHAAVLRKLLERLK